MAHTHTRPPRTQRGRAATRCTGALALGGTARRSSSLRVIHRIVLGRTYALCVHVAALSGRTTDRSVVAPTTPGSHGPAAASDVDAAESVRAQNASITLSHQRHSKQLTKQHSSGDSVRQTNRQICQFFVCSPKSLARIILLCSWESALTESSHNGTADD